MISRVHAEEIKHLIAIDEFETSICICSLQRTGKTRRNSYLNLVASLVKILDEHA